MLQGVTCRTTSITRAAAIMARVESPAPERDLTPALAWTLAVSFVLATLIVLLLSLNITAPAPQFREGEAVLVDNIVIDVTNQGLRWPQDLVANLLYAVGFAAVAGLGATLPRRLRADEDRTRLAGAALVVAGALGVVGQLLYVGVKELGINAQYCECALRDAQLISRAEALTLAVNAQGWLIDGFAILLGVSLLAAARVASATAALTAGWRWYTRWFGIAAIAYVLLRHLLDAAGGPEGSFDDLALVLLAVVAGVLTPLWAAWTARTVRRGD